MNLPSNMSLRDAKLFLGVILSQPIVLLAVLEAAILIGLAGKIVSYGLYYFLGWRAFYWASVLLFVNSLFVSVYYAYLRIKYKKKGEVLS